MGDVNWSPPEDYRQSWTNSCWAAVLHAFCKKTPGRPKISEQQLADYYDAENNRTYTYADGTIKPDGLRKIVTEPRFGMKVEAWDPTVFTSKPDYLAQKLGSGMVILAYYEPAISGGHVCLVYGIRGSTVSYLNPDARNGGLLQKDLSYFKQPPPGGKILVCSRAW